MTISSSPLTTFSNSWLSCTLAAVSVTCADQRVGFIHRHMRLVTVMRLALFHRVTRVAVTAGFIFLGRRAARRLQQRRVHQRAGLQNQALVLAIAG